MCFSDEYQKLLSIRGTAPLLHVLADYLGREAKDIITITNVLIHARVPLIKAESVGAYCDQFGRPIPIDISIDSPLHSGLATTELVCTMMRALPPLGPVAYVLKEYLKLKGLDDSFTGGLNGYGVILLVLIEILQKVSEVNENNVSHTVAVGTMEGSDG